MHICSVLANESNSYQIADKSQTGYS